MLLLPDEHSDDFSLLMMSREFCLQAGYAGFYSMLLLVYVSAIG
jgi:hypothetical protein